MEAPRTLWDEIEAVADIVNHDARVVARIACGDRSVRSGRIRARVEQDVLRELQARGIPAPIAMTSLNQLGRVA